MKVCKIAAVLFVVGAAACWQPPETPSQPDGDTQWQSLPAEEMSDAQRAQHEMALTAVNTLATELMAELVAALDEGGPVKGISVCRDAAPVIAAEVAKQHQLEIGRTSFALRNPDNQPPRWAETAITERVAEPALFRGPEDALGALLPIRLRAECQMCHGPAETVSQEVREAISAHYPQDQAVGFAEGDLRGWFWVEVPATAAGSRL